MNKDFTVYWFTNNCKNILIIVGTLNRHGLLQMVNWYSDIQIFWFYCHFAVACAMDNTFMEQPLSIKSGQLLGSAKNADKGTFRAIC